MLLTFLLLFHILGLISAFNAVMTARTSQGATAWVISLITVPYIALPLYWFFGRSKFNGYTAARKKAEAKVADKLKEILSEIKKHIPKNSSQGLLESTSEQLTQMPYLQGNELELLIDGENTFNSILEGIEQAERYILMEFYIVRDDDLGKRVQKALIKKAHEGVKIYFLYDEIGCYKLSKDYITTLREAGIEIYDFHTQKGVRNRFQVNFRNHRKIVVIDGKSAWIGGHNIGDEYLSKNKKFGHWRDTHLKITGPSALVVQKTFIDDWYWAAEYLIKDLRWKVMESDRSNKKVLILPSSPADTLETASLMFLQAISSAKKRIWISSPYFVPDSAIIKALQLAALRGIDVRILIPNKADHLLVYLAAFTYFETVNVAGVKIFRYQDGFLHQKVMIVDDSHASVGTVNLDNRSLRLNFEITALVADDSFASQVRQMLENDFLHSHEVQIQEIQRQSFFFKLITRLARLAAPVL